MQFASVAGNGGQPHKMLMGQLLVLLLVIELAVAVPASVLAQNTELSTNANNKQQQHQLQQQQQQKQPAAGECQSSQFFGVRGLQLDARLCLALSLPVCVCAYVRLMLKVI